MTESQENSSKSAPTSERNWLDRNVWVLIKPTHSTLKLGEMFGDVPLPKPLALRIWLEEAAETLYRKSGLAPQSDKPPHKPFVTLSDVFSLRPTYSPLREKFGPSTTTPK